MPGKDGYIRWERQEVSMSRRLYDALKDCKKEDEVKSSFCSFFKMKINAIKVIDHYTPNVLFRCGCYKS